MFLPGCSLPPPHPVKLASLSSGWIMVIFYASILNNLLVFFVPLFNLLLIFILLLNPAWAVILLERWKFTFTAPNVFMVLFQGLMKVTKSTTCYDIIEWSGLPLCGHSLHWSCFFKRGGQTSRIETIQGPFPCLWILHRQHINLGTFPGSLAILGLCMESGDCLWFVSWNQRRLVTSLYTMLETNLERRND